MILLVILLLFGAERLPKLARSVGKSFKEFKRALNSAQDDLTEAMDCADKPEETQNVKPRALEDPAETKNLSS